MSDVKISVRLRRKTGDDLRVFAACQVGGDDFADEVFAAFFFGIVSVVGCHFLNKY